MKKNLSYIFTVALAMMSLAACSPETDKVFDEDASQRIEEFNNNLEEVLVSAANGWRMEYYASTTYGGYNLFMKFTDSSVTVASEAVGTNGGFDDDGNLKTATSHYKVDQSMGSILSFDGYNEIFHYYSDPKNPDGTGTDGNGMGGDLEFRVRSACADSIVMTGKKHGNKIVMYPISSDKTWESVANTISETETYMTSSSYTFEVEGSDREVSAYLSYRRLVFNYTDDSGESQQVIAPYIVTEEGYKFYEPCYIDSVYVTGFLKGTTDDYFVATNDSNVRIETYLPPLAESLQTGMWFISYDYLGEYAQPSWDAMRENLKTTGPNKTKQRLYWALIGTYGKKEAIHLQFGSDYGYYGITFTSLNDEGDEVNLKVKNGTRNNVGKEYYQQHGLKDAMEPFVGSGSAGRNFKLSTDSQRHPTYMLLTDMDEPTNIIRLFYDQVTYVYGDLDADEK